MAILPFPRPADPTPPPSLPPWLTPAVGRAAFWALAGHEGVVYWAVVERTRAATPPVGSARLNVSALARATGLDQSRLNRAKLALVARGVLARRPDGTLEPADWFVEDAGFPPRLREWVRGDAGSAPELGGNRPNSPGDRSSELGRFSPNSPDTGSGPDPELGGNPPNSPGHRFSELGGNRPNSPAAGPGSAPELGGNRPNSPGPGPGEEPAAAAELGGNRPNLPGELGRFSPNSPRAELNLNSNSGGGINSPPSPPLLSTPGPGPAPAPPSEPRPDPAPRTRPGLRELTPPPGWAERFGPGPEPDETDAASPLPRESAPAADESEPFLPPPAAAAEPSPEGARVLAAAVRFFGAGGEIPEIVAACPDAYRPDVAVRAMERCRSQGKTAWSYFRGTYDRMLAEPARTGPPPEPARTPLPPLVASDGFVAALDAARRGEPPPPPEPGCGLPPELAAMIDRRAVRPVGCAGKGAARG